MRTGPIRFGIVGSGWRAEFFVRLARALPERLAVAGVVTRSAERVAQLKAEWGVPAFRTVSELCAAEPEFVIPSVPWEITPQVVQELVEREVPVLAETPCGARRTRPSGLVGCRGRRETRRGRRTRPSSGTIPPDARPRRSHGPRTRGRDRQGHVRPGVLDAHVSRDVADPAHAGCRRMGPSP